MKRLHFLLIVLVLAGSSVLPAHAQSPLNAGIVSSIWYDTATVPFGADVTIHSAFYNESDRAIEGVAIFRDNDAELGKVAFTAQKGALTPLAHVWRTTEGTHAISVSIEGVETAVAVARAAMTIEVKKPVVVTPPVPSVAPLTVETVKTVTLDTIAGLTKKADAYAGTLAETLQSHKVPVAPEAPEGRVLSASTAAGESPDKDETATLSLAKAKNAGIDSLTWVVRNWQWGALALLVLLLLLLRRMHRR